MLDYIFGLTFIPFMISAFTQMFYMMIFDDMPNWKNYSIISGIVYPLLFAFAYFTDPNLRQYTMMFLISASILSLPFLYHIIPIIMQNRSPLTRAVKNRHIEYENRVAHYIILGMNQRDAEEVVTTEFRESSRNLMNTYKQLGV